MKLSKNLLVLLSLSIISGGLLGCGKNSNSTSKPNNTSVVPFSSTDETQITQKEDQILNKIAKGEYSKQILNYQNSLKARYEVKDEDVITTYIYLANVQAGDYTNFDIYVGFDNKTKKIVGVEYDGMITSHGKDQEFITDGLNLIGSEGNQIEVITGATVSSNAIIKAIEEMRNHLNTDLN